MGFQRGVHIVDVCLMVFGVMDFHRPRIDVRLERAGRIGKSRERVRHDEDSFVREQPVTDFWLRLYRERRAPANVAGTAAAGLVDCANLASLSRESGNMA
jgi:hypothetical protein